MAGYADWIRKTAEGGHADRRERAAPERFDLRSGTSSKVTDRFTAAILWGHRRSQPAFRRYPRMED